MPDNIKITAGSAWATPIATDILPIVDITAGTTKKITYGDLLGKIPAGSVTAPTIAFTGDPNSGPYWIGADNIGLALGGAKALDFGANQLGIADGTVAAPGLGFFNDANCGLYRIGADNIGLALGGVKKVDFLLTSVQMAVDCCPASASAGSLGTATLPWDNLFLDTGAIININNGDVTITHSANTLAFAGASSGYTFDSIIYVNDTSDANLTTGIVINQGGADNHIVSLKSSDVAHGMTANLETDTYGSVDKATAATGGLRITGWAGGTTGLFLRGIHTTDNTTKSTAATGAVILQGGLKAAADHSNCGADANLVVIRNHATARFIFDAEGSGHADVEWVAFAGHDDLALVNDMERELVARETGGQTERRHSLEVLGVIGRDSWHLENGRPRAMVNFTKLAMLHHGALMQVGERFTILEQALMARISGLERQVLALQGGGHGN